MSLAHNLIAELPTDLSSLAVLAELNLAHNQLSKWPSAALHSLPALRSLDLAGNAIGSLLIDDKSALRSRLLRLSLAGNRMTSFPLHVCFLHGLLELDLSDNGIILLAEQVGQLTSLALLRIRSNQLQELPNELCACTTLRALDFAHNALKGVPDDLPQLSELRELDLSHNQFASVAPAICRLPQLAALNLGGNKIKALPPAIGELENLASLTLAENLLTDLPPAVFSIQALRRLDCAFNQLSALPKAEEVPPLVQVVLHHNQFRTLPKQLLVLKSLLVVSLDWNPFDNDAVADLIRDEGAMAIVQRQRIADAKARASARKALSGAGREDADLTDALAQVSVARSIDRDAVQLPTLKLVGDRKVSKFQLLFDATVQRCDFSPSVAAWVKQLDFVGRWRLVMQYDLPSMALLTAPRPAAPPPSSLAAAAAAAGAGASSVVGSLGGSGGGGGGGGDAGPPAATQAEQAEQMVDELRMRKMPAEAVAALMTQLKRTLDSPPDGFVLRFVVAGGIAALVEHFNNVLLDALLTVENLGLKTLFFDVVALTGVAAALFERAPVAFVRTPGAVNMIAMCMSEAVCADAFALMEKVSRFSTSAVYDALRHYQRAFGTNFRFGLLVAAFDSNQDLLALRESSFRIINRLVSEVDEVEERFDLRNEIMRAGMSEVMGDAKDKDGSSSTAFAQLVADFEALADADFAAMIDQFGQEAVMERLETFMAEADDLGDDLLRCTVMCGGEVRGTCTVPYTAATTGRDVRDILLAKFPIVEPAAPPAAAGAAPASAASASAASPTVAAPAPTRHKRSSKKRLDKDSALSIAAPFDVLNEKMYGLYVHAKDKQQVGFWIDLAKTLGEYPSIEGDIKAEFRMKPWLLYVQHGEDEKAHTHSFAPMATFGEAVAALFEKLDMPGDSTPLDYGLYITDVTYSRSKKGSGGGGGDADTLSRSRAGSVSESTAPALPGDDADQVEAATRSWVDDDKRLLDLPQLSKQRTVLLLAKRPQPLRVTLLDANEPTTFFFDETDTIAHLKRRFLSRVLSSMPADALATASREVEDYALLVESPASATAVGAGGAGPSATSSSSSSTTAAAAAAAAATLQRKASTSAAHSNNDDDDDDASEHSGDDSGLHSTLPTGDVTLSASSLRVVSTELPSSATLAECRKQLVAAGSSPLRFGRRPRSVRVQVPSEGIGETVPLDVTLPQSKLLSALCAKFELPTTNEYVLATQVNGEFVALDGRQTLLQSGATALWLRVDSEAAGLSKSDVNIWDEPSGAEFITYDDVEKKKVLAATFNKLVELLTSTEEYDRDFLDVFLMTYKAFATAEQLLKKLGERWNAPARIDADLVRRVRLRIGVFLRNYIASESRLGFKRSVKDKLERFIRDVVMAGGGEFVALGDGLLKTLNDTPLGRKRAPPSLTQPAPKPTAIETHISSAQMNFTELSEVEIAEQMSWYLFQIYEQIEHTELFNGNWAKKGGERTSRHVLRMIDYFNYTSTWVATLIVSEKKYKARVKLLEKFVRIAHELRKLNNYHLAMAFLVAFNNSAISRLKWTFAKLPKKVTQMLRDVETLMSMEGSFKQYRGALEQVDTPCVPYVGVALTDLTFVEEGNPNKQDSKIYFVKQRFVHNIVNQLLRFQHLSYSGIQPVDSLVHFINGQPKLDDKQLYAQSLLLEPRGAPQPKW